MNQFSDCYLSNERMGIQGFVQFCKKNKVLVILVSISLLIIYGIKLSFYSISADTELFMANDRNMGWVERGRFGLVLLQKVWYIQEFNPYVAFLVTFLLIWIFSLTWTYLIAIFDNRLEKNSALIVFALLFSTFPIWVEQFSFVIQSAEIAFILVACPVVTYYFFEGIVSNNKTSILVSIVLLAFLTSVYQSIIILFCCSVLACFILFRLHTDYSAKMYRSLCLKLAVGCISALILYFLSYKLVSIVWYLNHPKGEILGDLIGWKNGFTYGLVRILGYGFSITLGNLTSLVEMMKPLIVSSANQGIDQYAKMMRGSPFASLLLIPLTITFWGFIIADLKKKRVVAGKLLYLISALVIPFSIMLLSIALGVITADRSQFCMPFALGFMAYFVLKKTKRRTLYLILMSVFLLVSVRQAEISAQLYYSDYIKYEEDVRIAYDLHHRISLVAPQLPDDSDTLVPVAFVGKKFTNYYQYPSFMTGEVLGKSFFDDEKEWRVIAFLKSLGINYSSPSEQQMEQARRLAQKMPSYPAKDSVITNGDYVIVKFSDTSYPFGK